MFSAIGVRYATCALEGAKGDKVWHRLTFFFNSWSNAALPDLLLSVGIKPCFKLSGDIVPLDEFGEVSAEEAQMVLTEFMPARNAEEFNSIHDTDFAYELPGYGRFRCNIFRNRLGMGGVFRLIPSKIVTSEELALPKSVMDFCRLQKGLVVVTGPTGSGKSTTLCAMIDYINRTKRAHILTIEDPIEFVHPNKMALINQREVHVHTTSFKRALKAALREAPDIVLIGEMRDLETIEIAIETAETGHLVFGTLHTTTAASTVDRLIDQFPADRQQQIRTMLSSSLKGVVAQNLLKKKGGGRCAALEVLGHNRSHVVADPRRQDVPDSLANVDRAKAGNDFAERFTGGTLQARNRQPRRSLFQSRGKGRFPQAPERGVWKVRQR